MHAFDSEEVSPQHHRLRQERRVLVGVLAGLLLTTALISPLAFGDLPLLLLYIVPFALALLLSVLVAPLGEDASAARLARDRATALRGARQAAATQHAILTPAINTLPEENLALLASAVAAAATHGIHFGCAHLSNEHFLLTFHSGDLRAADFRHGDHLRYTVLMLQRVPAGLAEETIAINLRTFLRKVCGSEALFHATRTHAWIAVLRSLPRESFAALLQGHGASLRGDALARFYSDDLLQSDDARHRAMSPDREPLPAAYAPIRSNTYPAIAPPTSGPRMGTQA